MSSVIEERELFLDYSVIVARVRLKNILSRTVTNEQNGFTDLIGIDMSCRNF